MPASKSPQSSVPAKEGDRHREAFAYWVECRNFREVAQRFRVSERSVRNWAQWFAWEEKADARAIEAARRVEAEAIELLQARLEDHRRAGEILRRRGVAYLVAHEIDNSRDAIAAIKAGIELERLSMGLPNWVFETLRMNDEQLEQERVNLIRLATQSGADQPALGDPEDAAIDAEWSEEEGAESA